MKRALSKDEEEAAFRRKNRQDPNPDRKGKAINVKTEETLPEATYPSDFKRNLELLRKSTIDQNSTIKKPIVTVVKDCR